MRFTGKAEVRVGGVLYPTADGAVLSNPTGASREPVVGVRVYGFTEKAEAPMIDAKFLMNSGISIDDIWNVVDQPIMFETDDGQIFTLVNGTTTNVDSLTSGGQAELAVKFFGTAVQ